MPKIFLYILYASSCLCAILKIAISYKFNWRRTFFGCFIVGLSTYLFIKYQYYIVAPVLLIFAAKNVSFMKILSMQYYTTIIMLWLILVAVFLGIISDLEFPKTVPWAGKEYSRVAHGLGFVYFSGFAYYIMLISFIFLMNKKRIILFNILVLALINVIVFALCFTRVQLIGVVLIIAFIYFWGGGKIIMRHKLGEIFARAGYPVFFIVTCISSVLMYADVSSEMTDTLNEYTASRFALNSVAFAKYGINLLGNKIENTDDTSTSGYFYIDSGYVYSIIGYGVLFSVLLLIAYSFAFYKAYKNGNYKLYAGFFVFMILSIFNDFFMQINYNPLLLYLFAQDTTKGENKVKV